MQFETLIERYNEVTEIIDEAVPAYADGDLPQDDRENAKCALCEARESLKTLRHILGDCVVNASQEVEKYVLANKMRRDLAVLEMVI